jgi:hypothetical protein
MKVPTPSTAGIATTTARIGLTSSHHRDDDQQQASGSDQAAREHSSSLNPKSDRRSLCEERKRREPVPLVS